MTIHWEVKAPDPELINDDLKPATLEERHWSVFNMASLWIGMVVCVPTYMLAAGLVDSGMNWWQAVLTIMLGNVIVLVPMILNGHAGTKYGVPFPVLARASFGIHGAHIPSILRGLVACGWFGIQTWFGGYAIYQLVNALGSTSEVTMSGAQMLSWGRTDALPALYASLNGAAELIQAQDWAGLVALNPGLEGKLTVAMLEGAKLPLLGINAAEFVCFLIFWAIQLIIIYRGIESIRLLETLAAPFLIAIGLVLLGWAYYAAGGFGAMLDNPGQFGEGGAKEGQFFSVFIPSLTAMVGFWATLSLNIPDFTRYAKSQRDQALGQALGLPTTMTLFAFISVAVTSATTVIFRDPVTGALAAPIPDPTILAGKIGGGVTVMISLFALAIATLSTNIAANVVSPANALINWSPQRFGFRLGGFITAGIGLAIMPWKLIASTGGYIFTWLVGYSALLGPIVGILLADYFIVRKTELDLEGLYREKGPYSYKNGYNPAAFIAFVTAVLPNIPGFLNQAGALGLGADGKALVLPLGLDTIYTYAWFVGFALAAGIYLALMNVLPHESLKGLAAEAKHSDKDSESA